MAGLGKQGRITREKAGKLIRQIPGLLPNDGVKGKRLKVLKPLMRSLERRL